MSILIKDMEMPKDEGVALYIYPDGRAKLWRPHALVGHEFEAIPVPTHGRLIDASVIWNLLYDYADSIGLPNMMHFDKIMEAAFSSAPTIIPAEGNLENKIHIIDTKGKPNYNPKHRFVISSHTIIPTEGGDVNGEV